MKRKEEERRKENMWKRYRTCFVSMFPGEFRLPGALIPFYIILDFASFQSNSLPVLTHLRFPY